MGKERVIKRKWREVEGGRKEKRERGMKRRREEETENRDAPVSTADILINRNVREALYLSICKDKVNREEERERERER